ncbi:hypothetical protein K0M31_015099 [Melipona bicolor]|uniref:Uncharacterized protein n=1 Tax=Melipona bicolor TaxID=60889 RepID=A0AA40FG47_9HYME|nr:hypothetical protein K0M31_015099 [Melipona bicolor]
MLELRTWTGNAVSWTEGPRSTGSNACAWRLRPSTTVDESRTATSYRKNFDTDDNESLIQSDSRLLAFIISARHIDSADGERTDDHVKGPGAGLAFDDGDIAVTVVVEHPLIG